MAVPDAAAIRQMIETQKFIELQPTFETTSFGRAVTLNAARRWLTGMMRYMDDAEWDLPDASQALIRVCLALKPLEELPLDKYTADLIRRLMGLWVSDNLVTIDSLAVMLLQTMMQRPYDHAETRPVSEQVVLAVTKRLRDLRAGVRATSTV